MGAFTGALDQGQQLADTPFNYGTTQNVAGFNPQQMQSFNQVGQAQGMFAPYIDAASGYTAAGAAPITGQQIQNYQNPYQQQVIDATMANINHQNATQQRDLVGNIAAQQGLGNNRAGVMQAELARGQGANTNQTIANLLSGGFNTALGAAQGDASRQLTAGNQMANYGNMAQNLSLQGSQALNSVGNQQQQQLQNLYNTASSNQQMATMWPYQNAQFQAALAAGLGPQMGGTTTGNSTTKQTASNPLGTALAIAGMLANGGRVGYAGGGSIDMSGFSFPGLTMQTGRQIIPQLPGSANMGGDQDSMSDPKKAFDIGKSARGGLNDIFSKLDPAKGWGASIEDIGGSSGGMLGGLGGLLGFADGGTLPAAPHLTGSAYIPAAGSVPGAAPDSYYAPGLAALTKSRGPQQAPAPSPISPPTAGVPTTGHGKGLGGLGGLFGQMMGGDQGGISDWIARLQQHHARGGAVKRYDDGGMVDSDPFASFGYDPRLKDADFAAPENPWYQRSIVDLATGNSKPHNIGFDEFMKQRNAPAPDAPDFNPQQLVPTQSMGEMAAPPAQNVGEVGDVPAGLAALGAPAQAQSDLDPFDLIKREEGFAKRAAWDKKQYSGGYGSKAEEGEEFDQPKAEAYLRRDAAAPLAWVEQNVPNATPQQRAVLTSFGYNEGVGALNNLKDDIASGDWGKVGQHIRLYNKARDDKTGELAFNPGLDARRQREVALLGGGDLGSLAQPSYPSPSGGDAPAAAKGLVAKGLDPEQPQVSKSYTNAADKHAGGLLKRLFGIDFNPLNLDRDERMALITAGLGMMSTGNIGSGGLMGMESLQNSAKMHQDANIAAQKLAMDFEKERRPVLMKGGTDANGNDIMVWADPYNRTTTRADIGGQQATGANGTTEIPENIAEKARNIIAGREKMPLATRGDKTAIQVQNAVRQMDKDYSDNRFKYRSQWENPNQSVGKTRIANNTAIGHAGELSDLVETLPDAHLGPASNVSNRAVNWWNRQTNDPDLAQWQATSALLADEIVKVMTGTAGSLKDREDALKQLDPGNGKDALNATLSKYTKLLASKTDALKRDWTKAMGPYAETPQVVDEENEAVLEKLKSKYSGKGDLTAQKQGSTLAATPRPAGKSDTQLLQDARNKLKERPDLAPKIQKQLQDWGVPF